MKKSSCREEELERLQRRYEGRGKEGKTRMLDEFCEQYGYGRKHAIKLLGDQLPKAKGAVRVGAEPVYEPVREVIAHIWKASEQLCGKRLEHHGACAARAPALCCANKSRLPVKCGMKSVQAFWKPTAWLIAERAWREILFGA